MSVPVQPKVLVPLAVLEGESLAAPLVEAISGLDVELVGYYELPEQTPPGQARMQFEERMEGELADLVTLFEESGGSVETRMVFTSEPSQTFERVAVEASCDAILLNNPATDIEDVLVPIRGEVNVDRIVALVANILDVTDATATLFHVVESDEEREAGRDLVDAAVDSMRAADVAPGRFQTEVVVSQTPVKTLVESASESDLVVMGESKPSVRELFFGEVSEQISTQSVTPVLLVRRLPAVDESERADGDEGDESPPRTEEQERTGDGRADADQT